MSDSFIRMRYSREYSLSMLMLIAIVVLMDHQYNKSCREGTCSQKDKALMGTMLALDTLIVFDAVIDLVINLLVYDIYKDHKMVYAFILVLDVIIVSVFVMHMLQIRDNLKGV
jgi:hypothetical protein